VASSAKDQVLDHVQGVHLEVADLLLRLVNWGFICEGPGIGSSMILVICC
jgi:hypothetical protein